MRNKITIFGGGLSNKGAQAMTFITVDEMSKRFPDHDIIVLSTVDYHRDNSEKSQYRFTILPSPRYRTLLLSAISKKIPILNSFIKNKDEKKLVDMLHNTDFALDISGYALGSDWGSDSAILYCLRIMFVRICGARVFLMPQSFGPFNFLGGKAWITELIIRKCLPYAERIMAREEEGYILLKSNFGLTNVVRSFDMVLQNKKIDVNSIFRMQPVLDIVEIKKDAVGIVPNQKTVRFGGEDRVFFIYDTIVEELKKHNMKIYFVTHSTEDKDLCQTLYGRYRNGYEYTYYLDRDMNCLEFNYIVSQFEFIVASRYHSVVHAYKNEIPAIVLGWAVKYKELMKLFGQENYQFNVRENIDYSRLKAVVEEMTVKCKIERNRIGQGLEKIRKENAFDYLQ